MILRMQETSLMTLKENKHKADAWEMNYKSNNIMEADVKQDIRYAIHAYGHLISMFQEVSGEQFSQMIANTYDCSNARNQYFCDIVRKNILTIRRQRAIFLYTLALN